MLGGKYDISGSIGGFTTREIIRLGYDLAKDSFNRYDYRNVGTIRICTTTNWGSAALPLVTNKTYIVKVAKTVPQVASACYHVS